MKVIIPTKVLNKINLLLENQSLINYTSTEQENKIKSLLIKLWFFIYNTQTEDFNCKNLDFYTTISKKTLENFKMQINGKRYKHQKFISLLEEANLIDTNGRYKVNSFSKSYRIVTSFIGLDFEEVEIDFKGLFQNYKTKEHHINKYPHLSNQIEDIYNTEIDILAFQKWLISNKSKQIDPVISKGVIKKRTLTNEKIYKYINEALKVNFKNIWIVQSKEGRLYSTLTNLTSTALPFIKVNNEKVIEKDVTNCQPLLLSSLVNNKEYKKDVENGVFYEKLAEKLGKTRSETKLLSYKYIFFGNKKLKSGQVYEAFNGLYKGLIKEINNLKEKENIAVQLQKLESHIFVNLNIKGSMLRHDAIFVKESDIKEAESKIKEGFRKLNLKVKIK